MLIGSGKSDKGQCYNTSVASSVFGRHLTNDFDHSYSDDGRRCHQPRASQDGNGYGRMGTILCSTCPDYTGHATLDALHLNIWCVPGIPTPHYIVDIGGFISVGPASGTAALPAILLGLPFVSSKAECLASAFSGNTKAWQLIFGRIVPTSWCKVQACERDEHSDGSYTVWRITFDQPVHAGERKYFRLRFADPEHVRFVHEYKVFPLAFHQKLFDIRIYEFREQWHVSDEIKNLFETRLLKVREANVFLIAPTRFQILQYSPQPTYIRILEGRAWEEYLRRKVSIGGGSEKLTIYSWKYVSKEAGKSYQGEPVPPLGVDHPSRVFIQFDIWSIRNALIRTIHYLFLLSVFGFLVLEFLPKVSDITIPEWLSRYPWIVGSITALEMLLYAGNLVSRWQRAKAWFSKALGFLDTWCYGRRR